MIINSVKVTVLVLTEVAMMVGDVRVAVLVIDIVGVTVISRSSEIVLILISVDVETMLVVEVKA